MSPLATWRRDCETRRKIGGVRTAPTHWANAPVHAFHRFTGETTLLVWCGLTVDLAAGGRQTTDLISCSACARGSLLALRG